MSFVQPLTAPMRQARGRSVVSGREGKVPAGEKNDAKKDNDSKKDDSKKNDDAKKVMSFAADIRPLFTQLDIDHMDWFCDLGNYEDVKTNADEISHRLKGQGGAVMPPPPNKGGHGPWPAENIALFDAWIAGGCQA